MFVPYMPVFDDDFHIANRLIVMALDVSRLIFFEVALPGLARYFIRINMIRLPILPDCIDDEFTDMTDAMLAQENSFALFRREALPSVG